MIYNMKKFKNACCQLRNFICIILSFLSGRCSFSKTSSFIREYSQRNKSRTHCKTYNNKRILTLDESNELISHAIESGQSFMAGRYGSYELGAMWKACDNGNGFIMPISKALDYMCSNAGFFPRDKSLLVQFAKLMKRSTSKVNLMGIWFQPMEEYELRTYGNNTEYCRLGHLLPFEAKYPWSAKLEGKKVLVIHPFYRSIPEQYKRRELLFPGKNILPEFELIMQRAVQTIAGNKDERFSNWFEALDYMYNEAMSKDFDVAIIGCGAYGFPLAAKIKDAGKIAIHLGGATQLLFGIIGKRWQKIRIRNENWVRPSEEERPSGFKGIEGGCYW